MGRQRFFFNLGALGAAVLLIVSAAAFGPAAVRGVGLGIGICACALSLIFVSLLVHQPRLQGHPELHAFGRTLGLWSTLAGAMASVTVWEIVGAAVFSPGISRWLTLANGVVILVLSSAGLIAHEISSERIIHVLEVVERPAP